MKYKANYSLTYTFDKASKKEFVGIKWLNVIPELKSKLGEILLESDIVYFNENGEILSGGEVVKNIPYQTLLKCEWYPVIEIKESIPDNIPKIVELQVEAKTEDALSQENRQKSIDVHNAKELEKMLDSRLREICKDEIKKAKELSRENIVRKNVNLANKAFSQVYGQDVIKKPVFVKNKKQKEKQAFDGDFLIYIDENNDVILKIDKKASVNPKFRIATQSEINKYFHGSKKRKDKEFELKNIMYYYCGDGGFYKVNTDKNNSGFIKITKEEYLKSIINKF